MQRSNFDFIAKDWETIAIIGKQAEKNLYDDPNTTIYKVRILAETIAKWMLKLDNLVCESDKQIDRIYLLKKNGLIPYEIEQIFKVLRIEGNKAVHENYAGKNIEEVSTYLSLAQKLTAWFHELYGNDMNFSADSIVYKMPERDKYKKDYENLVKRFNEAELKRLQTQETAKIDKEIENIDLSKLDIKSLEDRKKILQLKKKVELNEIETRMLIDEQLREAGWEVDTIELDYKNKKVMPQRGKMMAIAEWPCKKNNGELGYADYVLFDGMCPLAIIEAKRYSEDVVTALNRDAKMYAKGIENIDGELKFYRDDIKEGEYKVPFVFGANGRSSNAILEKSGVLFENLIDKKSRLKGLKGFYSLKDLKGFLDRDTEKIDAKLRDENSDYLTSEKGLNLRYYQVEAIKAVEEALLSGKNKVLITMATGTGKTRTALGLLYRLVKTNKYKRILFVVDRTALGEQAMDTFENVKIEQGFPITDIHDILGLKARTFDDGTRIHIATIQSLIKRIGDINSDDVKNGENQITVGSYDCIFVDEAHRGYNLERELSEEESLYVNEEDYLNKYRGVLEFFDADRIGLTATPALHTVEIFGRPVYDYGYNKAVIDGYLVDREPPYIIKTKLSEEGIHYDKGENITIFDNNTKEVIELEELPDEMNFELKDFNTKVITEEFNRVVCSELVKYIDLENPEKTLIFAASDAHADTVVRILKEEYSKIGENINLDDAIVKITGSVKDVADLIKRYKVDEFPKIAVTVDLLTTGVDVPRIVNLVFLRATKSRILYHQMLGRATRKCDEIGKEFFRVFDAVGIVKAMEKVSDMKSVVKKPSISMDNFLNSVDEYKNDEKAMETILNEIVARLQRKRYIFEQRENKKSVEYKLGNKSFDDFVKELKNTPKEKIYTKIKEVEEILKYLDKVKKGENYIVYSDKKDELVEVERMFGDDRNAKDYLENFKKYIEEHKDEIPALRVLSAAPKNLTKAELLELKRKLSEAGYKEIELNTAYGKENRITITSDILDFVKNAIRGSMILDKEKRVSDVIDKIKKMENWTPNQLKLIDRIGKIMRENTFLSVEDFEESSFKKNYGDYNRINKILGGNLENILELVKEDLLLN